MSLFQVYFKIGLEHITDLNGYDHMLFLLVLAAPFTLVNWKKVLFLATAFTFGHGLSMTLAILDLVYIPSKYVEFLIPLTILIGCIGLFFMSTDKKTRYSIVIFFGLIHGLGFSNFLKSMLGRGDSIIKPLFYFHIGLELGQLIIILLSLLISSIALKSIKIPHQNWQRIIGALAGIVSLYLLFDRRFW